jgi:hypothetical protein
MAKDVDEGLKEVVAAHDAMSAEAAAYVSVPAKGGRVRPRRLLATVVLKTTSWP